MIVIDPRDLAIIRRLLAPWADQIQEVAIFGSRALGTARAGSDIDLVIHGSVSDADIDRMWTLFDDSGISVTVDLVAFSDDLYPPLRRHIEQVARPILSRDDLRAIDASPVSLAADSG